MQLCEYVFAMGFPLCVPNKWGFGGEDVKVLCSDPQKALPCVNKRLLVYRMSKSVQRFKLQVQGMILHTNKEIKKLSDNFGQYRIQRGGWGMHPPTGVFEFFYSQPDASYLLIPTAVRRNQP